MWQILFSKNGHTNIFIPFHMFFLWYNILLHLRGHVLSLWIREETCDRLDQHSTAEVVLHNFWDSHKKNTASIWGSPSWEVLRTQWPGWDYMWMFQLATSRHSIKCQTAWTSLHMIPARSLWIDKLRPQISWSRNKLSPLALSEFLTHMRNNKW